ncbi:unnamed protein product [Caenorhabditis auriculariae]|uniref:CUB domain-containing protein n=1 Tax=Caenorhabditis auriculariae TaxID=2777116 RepID=A0A8S1HSB5_9PELO|nr:unnamed protein product [Caenorhabditis auriculariae]
MLKSSRLDSHESCSARGLQLDLKSWWKNQRRASHSAANMRLFLFGLLVLLPREVQSQSSMSTISTSPAFESSSGSSHSTSTISPATKTSKGSTISKGTENPTGSPASTSESASSTTGQPETTGTTTTAQLPNVTVNYISFAVHCDVGDGGKCVYQYDTPKNDAGFVATEQSLVNDDKIQYNRLNNNATKILGNAKKANDDAVKKLQNLQAQLAAIQLELDALSATMNNITALQSTTGGFISQANSYFDSIRKNQVNSCYYMSCLKPTPPPPPPATTPTPPPTTSSPCANFCPVNTTCSVDSSMKPFCSPCEGNLNGYQSCEMSICTNGAIFTDGTDAPFVSPGFYYANKSVTVGVPTSKTCTWTVNPNATGLGYAVNNVTVTSLDPSVSLSITYGSTTQKITNATVSERLLGLIFGRPNTAFTVTMTTTSSTPNSTFFYWLLTPKTAATEEIEPSAYLYQLYGI